MTPEQHRAAGVKGGETTKRRYGLSHYHAIALKGGESTKAKYGREHFVAAGKKSAAARRARKEGNGTIGQETQTHR